MDRSEAKIGYALLDEDTRVVAADSVFRAWLGGRTIAELLPGFSVNSSAETRGRNIEFRPIGSESALADIECTRIDGDDCATFVLRIKSSENPSSDLQYRDAVTGLPDRRALAAHRADLLRQANGKLPHAVLFMDLDNFKQINDSQGHAVGDQVLAVLAERWRKSLRGRDLIVRYGGDEFVVLLAGVCSRADAQPIVDRLRKVTVAPIKVGDVTLAVSVAIGIALASDATVPLSELLDEADKAMYAAKRQTS